MALIFPLLILGIFFITSARTNCANRVCATSNELTNIFSVFWRDCKCCTLVIASKRCSEVHCRTSKKELNSASVKTSNWFLYFKKKNPQPKAVHLSLVDFKKKKKKALSLDLSALKVVTVILIKGLICKFFPTDYATMLY